MLSLPRDSKKIFQYSYIHACALLLIRVYQMNLYLSSMKAHLIYVFDILYVFAYNLSEDNDCKSGAVLKEVSV